MQSNQQITYYRRITLSSGDTKTQRDNGLEPADSISTNRAVFHPRRPAVRYVRSRP